MMAASDINKMDYLTLPYNHALCKRAHVCLTPRPTN